jgi:pilus assembly protein FimV
LAIYIKLLEIYAKRKDVHGFSDTANQAYRLTSSSGADWARICEMGLSIDPDNEMYSPGGAPAGAVEPAAASGNSSFGASTIAQSAQADFSPSKAVDLDLDLDFSLDEDPPSAISDVTSTQVEAPVEPEGTVKMQAQPESEGMSLDFDISSPVGLSADTDHATPSLDDISLSFDAPAEPVTGHDHSIDFSPTNTLPVEVEVAPDPSVEKDTGMLEFDMNSLSLDLESSSEQLSESPSAMGEDPLETKLALAEEFISIGDEDGARALIEEVLSEASGDIRAKAQKALANLS